MTEALGQHLSPGILLEQGLHLSARRRDTEIGSGITRNSGVQVLRQLHRLAWSGYTVPGGRPPQKLMPSGVLRHVIVPRARRRGSPPRSRPGRRPRRCRSPRTHRRRALDPELVLLGVTAGRALLLDRGEPGRGQPGPLGADGLDVADVEGRARDRSPTRRETWRPEW
jgi:hypothetical protein